MNGPKKESEEEKVLKREEVMRGPRPKKTYGSQRYPAKKTTSAYKSSENQPRK